MCCRQRRQSPQGQSFSCSLSIIMVPWFSCLLARLAGSRKYPPCAGVASSISTFQSRSQPAGQSGSDPLAQAFRQLLLRLRDGNVSRNDWQMLLHRSPQQSNGDTFDMSNRQFCLVQMQLFPNGTRIHVIPR